MRQLRESNIETAGLAALVNHCMIFGPHSFSATHNLAINLSQSLEKQANAKIVLESENEAVTYR
jgi:hypothetical protein